MPTTHPNKLFKLGTEKNEDKATNQHSCFVDQMISNKSRLRNQNLSSDYQKFIKLREVYNMDASDNVSFVFSNNNLLS